MIITATHATFDHIFWPADNKITQTTQTAKLQKFATFPSPNPDGPACLPPCIRTRTRSGSTGRRRWPPA